MIDILRMDRGRETCTVSKDQLLIQTIPMTEIGMTAAEMAEVIMIHTGINNNILHQTFVKEDLLVDPHPEEIIVELPQEDDLVIGVLEEDVVDRQWVEVVVINGVDLAEEDLPNGGIVGKDQEILIIVVDMGVGDQLSGEYYFNC